MVVDFTVDNRLDAILINVNQSRFDILFEVIGIIALVNQESIPFVRINSEFRLAVLIMIPNQILLLSMCLLTLNYGYSCS